MVAVFTKNVWNQVALSWKKNFSYQLSSHCPKKFVNWTIVVVLCSSRRKNYKNKAKFYKQKRNLISRKFRQNIISQILRLHFWTISRKNLSFHEKFVKTSCVRKFNHISTISRKKTTKLRRILQPKTNFTKNSSKRRTFFEPKKCVSAPDAAMVKCDNCHDKIVSDELTSWPLQVCGDKPIRGLPQLFEFNGFFPLL